MVGSAEVVEDVDRGGGGSNGGKQGFEEGKDGRAEGHQRVCLDVLPHGRGRSRSSDALRCAGKEERRRGGEEGKPEPNRVELRVQVIEGALPVMAKR